MMQKPLHPIMIVDDIKTNLIFLKSKLQKFGIEDTLTCQDSRQVTVMLERYPVEILLLDLKMPHIDGESLLVTIREKFSELPVIIVTDVHEVKTAVKCIRDGAFDYVTKPIDEDLFYTSIQRALAFRNLQRENMALKKYLPTRDDLDHPEAFAEIVTQNTNMFKIFNYIEMVAKTSQPILITGETGVGKELIARSIHQVSPGKGSLVSVNIAGLDDNIVADVLFGHVKGAFTGADTNRPGLIEQAKEGTLFLDEIGDLSMTAQVKLLRLLQEGEYLPLGSDKVKRSNARIIVATNQDLWKIQKAGKFREDLLFRLRIHHIQVPALVERMDDIPLLMNHFLKEVVRELGRNTLPQVPKEVFRLLARYTFPGNIRELKAMIYDAVSRNPSAAIALENFEAFCSPEHLKRDAAEIQAEMLGNSGAAEEITFPRVLPTIKEATESLIAEAVQRAKGNQTVAAKMLGISQPALNKRLKKKKD